MTGFGGVKLQNGSKLARKIPALNPRKLNSLMESLSEQEAREMVDDIQRVEASFSISCLDFDSNEFYWALIADICVKMHQSIARVNFHTSREGKGFKLNVPLRFMLGPFLSIARLAGFKVKRLSNGSIKLTGSAESLQKMGVCAESHPSLLDPFVCVEFVPSQFVGVMSYYQQFWVYGKEFDYQWVINPLTGHSIFC